MFQNGDGGQAAEPLGSPEKALYRLKEATAVEVQVL